MGFAQTSVLSYFIPLFINSFTYQERDGHANAAAQKTPKHYLLALPGWVSSLDSSDDRLSHCVQECVSAGMQMSPTLESTVTLCHAACMTSFIVQRRRHKEPTEWEDLQRKYGNLPPKEEVWKPERYAPSPEIVKDKAWIDGHQEAEELSDLEDEFADDRFLEEYRYGAMEKWMLTYKLGICLVDLHITQAYSQPE
eukprot:804815-Pelagomonas_calceolata.AAC.8